MILGKFINSNTVTGTQIRLDNNQWLRGRNFADSADINIFKITTANLIEFKSIPYVEGQGRLALYSEIDGIISFVEYLYGQLSEVTEDISTIQSDIVTIQGEIDDLQSEAGDFALKDLSNLTATSIPDGVNLESLSSSFVVKTKNQLSTVSGDIAFNSGNTSSSYKSGYVLISSGVNNSANASTPSTASTGLLMLYTGDMNGVQGTSGSIEMISGYVLSNNFTGDTGSINIETGWVQGTNCSGNTGATTISSGRIFHATSNGNTGIVSISSGNNAGPGNSGAINIASGTVSSGNSGNVNISTGTATSGARGDIEINGQNTTVYLKNYDVTGSNSLFRITNSSPGSVGDIQFLTYAKSNNTMGMRIFNSDPSSGFSIDGWGKNNENGGPFYFMSTKAYPTINGTLTGGDFNLTAASTDYIDPALGLNASVNSGNVNINTADGYITGTNTDANSGNINIFTGDKQGSGNRGNINLTAPLVQLTDYSRLVLNDTTGDRLVRLQLSNGVSDGDGQFFFNRIRSNKSIYIGAMESHVNDNGAPVYFSGTFILSSIDGQYKSSDVYLQSNSYANFQVATNVAISTGDVYIRSESSFVQGTELDANTGNITLQTGTPSGSGSKGYISLNGSHVTANSTQIKDVADPTAPQDALTLNYFNNNIPSVVEFDFYPLQAYNTYATIYANGSAGILDPVTPTNPRAGWYFKNSAGSPEKINWYFFDGTIVSCQLQNFSAFAVVTFDSIASLPFFSFYTFPTGSGDVSPFAHSEVVYSTPYTPSAVSGTKYLIYFGNEPEVFPYLPRIQLTYNAAASGGDQGATELVSTCAFSTDSGASANNVQVMVENLGLNLPSFKAYFDLLILPVFQQDVIAGQYSMPNSVSTFTVSGLTIGTTNYIVNVTIENIVDATVRHLTPVITAKTITSFSFVTSQTTDHANYKANYIITLL